MSGTLRIKRRAVGGAAGAPASLAAAEIAYNEQDDTLYYGKGDSGGTATSIVPIAGPGAFQTKDADLTSLAAASSVGVLYYRSAADTWGPVTIGSGLSFTSGTLSASASGGNVSNSGTPTAGQVAEWTDATHVQGVSTYAKLASPVFTGDPQAPTPATTDNDTSIATTAYVRNVVRTAYGVRGLTGSAGITLGTQIVINSYIEAVLHDSAGVGVLVKNGSFTLASGTVGANGCDVALSDGDVSVYAIWGSTPGNAGICSNANPGTGPALPSGYTHWAYLTTVKRSSGTFYAVAIRGNKVFYQTSALIANGVNASSWTSYSTAAFVPLVALNIFLNCYAAATTTGAGGLVYYVGWNNTSQYVVRLDTGYATPSGVSVPLQCTLPNVSQVVWHQWQTSYNVGNFATNGFYIYVIGFEVPNDA